MRDPIKIIAQNYHGLSATKPKIAVQPPVEEDCCIFYNPSNMLQKMAMSFIQANKPSGRKFDNGKSQYSLNLASVFDYDFGPGHYIQRVARALNLKVPLKPKGFIDLKDETIDSSRVLIATDGLQKSDFPIIAEFVGLSDYNFL